jgi:hypothetical protein
VQDLLYALGAAAEFLGILLVAAPDVVPGATRAAGWLRRRWRGIGAAAGNVPLAGPVSAIVSASAQTTEEKLEYLVRRLDELVVVRALTDAETDYRTARIAGTVFLALGLGISTAGNFLR